ncbi:MAG: SDR family NAD(P)-dependent oxidoreductase [Sandaracinaceae bacterium]
MSRPERQTPLAIVGVGALFPGADGAEGFLRQVLEARDAIREVPATHWLADAYYDPDVAAEDRIYVREGGFLDPVAFDPLRWGIPPTVVPATDSTQLLALLVADEVLRDAGLAGVDRDRISVILGVTGAQKLLGEMNSRLQRPVWVKALRELGLPEPQIEEACRRIAAHYVPWQESTFPGVLGNVVAGRIANRLDLGGTNCVIDAACASTFGALAMAADELSLGHADAVLCGGADTMNDPFMFHCFAKTTALSRSGRCRPFDEAADGTMLGEGVGLFAVLRLEDAEAQGLPIYAVVRGIGRSSDGRARSVYAPRAEGQAKALRRAYAAAGYGPETVELVEAHGTGTAAGDLAEVSALTRVFDEAGRADRAWCALGSVKSQIGHTKAAAGAAGLLKAVLALRHAVLPPTRNVERPSAALRLDESPFHVNTVARPWIRTGDHPRRASVSAFGFGGSNFHVTVEEYRGPTRAPRLRTDSAELIVWSGGSGAAVRAMAERDRDAAEADGLAALGVRRRAAFDATAPVRLAMVVGDAPDLAAKLALVDPFLDGEAAFTAPGGVALGFGDAAPHPVLLFPGQGSQRVGMGADLAIRFEPARAVWDRAADLPLGEEPLHRVVFPPPAFTDATREAQAQRLTATEWAQPALAAASLATLAVLRALGVEARAVAGHSFGELTALGAAGVLAEEDVLRLARRRGEHMAAGSETPGAMIAVAAGRADIERWLAETAARVTLANDNHPRQVVLSGSLEGVAEAERSLGARGLATTRLPVATAFHSPLVEPAVEAFRRDLEGVAFQRPLVPVVRAATAAPYPADGTEARDALARQLAEPVRFVELVDALHAGGARTFVEVGPGRVLSGLVERILGERPHRAVPTDRPGTDGVRALYAALAELAAAGVPLTLSALDADVRPPSGRDDPPRMALTLTGANYGKPYPDRAPAAMSAPNGGSHRGVVLDPPQRASTDDPGPSNGASLATRGVERADGSGDVAAAAPTPVRAASGHRPTEVDEAPEDHSRTPVRARSVDPAWLEAFRETQRQTAEAHAAYQRAMAQSHEAYLRTSELALQGLADLVDGGAALGRDAAPSTVAAGQPVDPPPPPEPTRGDRTVTDAAPGPAGPSGADGRGAGGRPGGAASLPAPAPDLTASLLQVISDKTGYPADLLDPAMALESDLGVDSIKRVEILAALKAQVPDLPDLDPARLGALRTIGEVVAALRDAVPTAVTGLREPRPSARSMPAEPIAPPPPEAAAPRRPPQAVPRHVLELVPSPRPGLTAPGLFSAAEVLVVDPQGEVGDRLAARLRAAGVAARVGSDAGSASAVIAAAGLAAAQAARPLLDGALRRARSLAPRVQERGGLYVVAHRRGAADGAEEGLAALARTARREWPDVTVATLTVDGVTRPEAIARAVADELLLGGGAAEVTLGPSGARRVPTWRPEPATAGRPAPARPVVLASGGARGVTARCLRALAEAIPGTRILLLGRTDLTDEAAALREVPDDHLEGTLARLAERPPAPRELRRQADRVRRQREVRRTLADLAATGAHASYEAVDVRDAEALRRVVHASRDAHGPITHVVHGAGVLADRRIGDLTDEDIDRVLSTKVDGLLALLEATREEPLEGIVLFSSVAAAYGNVGQAAYAAANGALDGIARAEAARRPGAWCRSLAWGPWDGGMVGASLREHFARQGVALLDAEDGARAFVEELRADGSSHVVLGSFPRAGAPAERTFDVGIGRATHPFLDGHVVDDVPVLPLVVTVDLFARAARALQPDLRVLEVRDLAVLRGVRLDAFDVGARFRIHAERRSNGHRSTLATRLVDADGAVRYRAVVELGPEPPDTPPSPSRPMELRDLEGALYGGALFHGPSFRVIDHLDGVGEEGASAVLLGARAMGWPEQPWVTDPALLDGGLQLAVLWAQHRFGGRSLPTGLERLVLHRPGPVDGPVTAWARARAAAHGRSVCDVALLDADGRWVAELQGVETHVLPSSLGTRAPAR